MPSSSYDDVRSMALEAVRAKDYDQAKVLASLLVADGLRAVSDALGRMPEAIQLVPADVPVSIPLVAGDDLPTSIKLVAGDDLPESIELDAGEVPRTIRLVDDRY